MNRLFNKLVNAVQQSFEGLAGDMPEIEWVKAVESYATTAFAARFSMKTAAKISGADIIMKAEDGRFFTRRKWDSKPVWHGMAHGEARTFRSPYLDSVLSDALERGMQTQPAAFDILQRTLGPHSERYFLIWNGTDEQVANLDKTHPTAPTGFKDHHVPEDYDDSHPYFAAYLRKIEYVPFRLKPENTPATQEKQPRPE